MIKHGALTLSDREGDGSLWVISCEKDAKEVDIPGKVDGMSVMGVGEYAFCDCAELTRVGFPEAELADYISGVPFSVIEEHAFMNCVSLVEAILPESVISVGHGAFLGCKSLVRARVPAITYLAAYAFARCPALSDINPTSSLSEGVFSECVSLREYKIPAGTEDICEDAFESCEGLSEMIIPSSVRRIEALAFRGCASLARVVFEEPSGWREVNSYRREDIPLDLTSPERNAEMLSRMDFDDGVIAWERGE